MALGARALPAPVWESRPTRLDTRDSGDRRDAAPAVPDVPLPSAAAGRWDAPRTLAIIVLSALVHASLLHTLKAPAAAGVAQQPLRLSVAIVQATAEPAHTEAPEAVKPPPPATPREPKPEGPPVPARTTVRQRQIQPVPTRKPLRPVQARQPLAPARAQAQQKPEQPAVTPARPAAVSDPAPGPPVADVESTARATHRPATRTTAGGQAPMAAPLLIREPRYRRPPTPPAYPRQAIRRHQQGTVLIRVRVSATGEIAEVRVVESSGYSLLDKSAVAAVRRWAFAPATLGGQPAEAWVQVPVRFVLRDRNLRKRP